MRRKVKSTPIQREILWALAETGELGLIHLLDSLRQKFLAYTPEILIGEVVRSIGVLKRMGCLYLDWKFKEGRKSVLVNEWQTLSLEKYLGWDDKKMSWIIISQDEELEDFVARLSRGGAEVLELIAEEYGGTTPVLRERVSGC